MDSNGNGSANCLPPNAQVGEYRLLGVIGEGGFGIVYRAQDLSLDRVVAIKEYLPATMASRSALSDVHVRSQHRGAFDAGLRSFINEARLLAKFSHPALVQVYRFFEGNGTAYMVMRCYEGQTLRAYLASQPKNLDERWLKATLCPLLDVLEMLHAADCYHRDIAPDNVFLQSSGMPVMLDFGAARRIISDMTQALTMVLKPGFAPIEQYAEDGSMPQGAWTDIYQLGALLYQVITGKTPTTAVARMINDPIKQLTPEQYPGYSTEFLAGVHRALAVKPQDRPQSIAELKSLLGISDFSTSSFLRFSSDVRGPDFSPSSQAPLAVETAHDSPFQVTTPRPHRVASAQLRAMPQVGSAIAVDTPMAAGSSAAHESKARPSASHPPETAVSATDALLALFDNPPVPGTSPDTQPASVATPKTSSQKKPEVRSPEAAIATGTGSRKSSAMAKPHQRSWLWVGAALVAVLLGTAIYWGATSDAPLAQSDEEAQWAAVLSDPTAPSLKAYLTAFPAGEHQVEAKQRLDTLENGSTTPTTAAPSDQGGTSTTEPDVTAAAPPAAPAVGDTVRTERPEALPPTEVMPSMPQVVEPLPQEEQVAVVRGKVVLRVTPWGRIYVNRVAIGITPPRMEIDLPEGQHRISVTNPAAPPMVWNIQVKQDEPVVLTHHFVEKPSAETSTDNQ